jgi:isocitrate dehydrogenase kinase/phosphatase
MLPWEDSVHQIYNTGTIYIRYYEKTQFIRYTIPTLSTYVTMRRLSQSDIQYRPYLDMLPWEDSFNRIYNTDPIYICYQEKTQSIRYTIPTLSTYVTVRRFSRSNIQYRPYLHMLRREDSVDQIYNTDPIYICYDEKTQSIRYTIQALSTYFTMRRLSSSDIQYRPYLHMLPIENSVNQIYNTDRIYICYHEKTQFIRYTIPALSTYITMRRLSSSDIQYRPYLHMLPWDDSADQIYHADFI